MSGSELDGRAVYIPLQGEQGVKLFVLEYGARRIVSSNIVRTFRSLALHLTPPLAYFKLEKFPRDPIPTLGQRLSDALAEIIVNRIGPLTRMGEIWPTGCDTDPEGPETVQLLVIPEEVVTRHTAIASLPAELLPRYAGAAARKTLRMAVGTLPRPSACAADPKQLFEHSGTLAGRPFGRCGPPTSIFDNHLAGLADALRDLTQAVPAPSSSKVAWALKFFILGIGFHENETEMEQMVWSLIDELLREGKWQQNIDGGAPWAHGPGWIYELKKQKGPEGDPEAQSIADYEKLLADETTMYGKIRDRSRLPTILISQAGPQLDIAVVIYAQVILVDQLFSINLRDGIDVDEQVLTLARLATCLTNTGAELRDYYNGLRQATAPVSPLVASALHLPAPASATPPHSLLSDDLGLKFLYKLSRITGEALNFDDETDRHENNRHAVFVALGGGIRGIPLGEEVVVKFTKRYNMIAHTKLAALGLAPKLYYHAAIRGGLLMTVMEKVAGTTAFRWRSLNADTRLPSSIYTDVDTAIRELHSHDLVFGDLRLPNIMVRVGERDGNGNDNGGKAQSYGGADASPQSDRGSARAGSRREAAEGSNNASERDGEPAKSDGGDLNFRALLIDFDWAAQDGVGRYPATISMSAGWAPGVSSYGLMYKAHDLYLLHMLRQQCN
ncbi:hypothetical protein K438DRAFT_2018362 [Mycena galopus ATCC 62051]|nr:hypothetical protein K438DRAFT_2018362 [Mycena galopus ATCC 62051]